MPGLDATVLDEIDSDLALRRIRADVLTDLILAPRYAAVFEHAGEDLWARLSQHLRSGTFEPSLPIVVEAPKATGVTRPGAILPPMDRMVYQALVDMIAPTAELQFDRDRVFSHVLIQPDPDGRMFESGHSCWERLQQRVRDLCEAPEHLVAIRADVSAYFERLYQHNLVNLLHSSGCPSAAVNLLEKLLAAWTEKDSHGIPQGMFPSDFLGNFYLCAVDAELEVQSVPSARFVDDIYIFYGDGTAARRGLTHLVQALRNEGLHLNERKTSILPTEDLLYEETELDRLFDEATEELETIDSLDTIYGFITAWRAELADHDADALSEGEVDGGNDLATGVNAVERLYNRVEEPEVRLIASNDSACRSLALQGRQRELTEPWKESSSAPTSPNSMPPTS